jgi:hypothetical protein
MDDVSQLASALQTVTVSAILAYGWMLERKRADKEQIRADTAKDETIRILKSLHVSAHTLDKLDS